MRNVAATIAAWACAMVLAGCLENPYPDSRLGMAKNVQWANLGSVRLPVPIVYLTLTRTPAGTLSLMARGNRYDSVEFVMYVARYAPIFPPALGTPFPNSIEYHGLLRDPAVADSLVAEIPDETNGADLRRYHAGGILLNAWNGAGRVGMKWSGVYSGSCTDPLRNKDLPGAGNLMGSIDADGYFNFRCFMSGTDAGSVTSGKIMEDSSIALVDHRRYGSYGGYDGMYDTTDTKLPLTWSGDSLSITFHLSDWTGKKDSSHIDAVRVKPRE